MATVKITLEKGENELDVCECLSKAFLTEHGGSDKFEDPVLDQLEQEWLIDYADMLQAMIVEIEEVLKQK